ncbi:uncharacterized protein [Henckelia pumila]|uniref:uncharacterized protein n=1 Tax=Henckelia pumila TaxID=405737 RepID=UPI003C6DDE23
MRDDGWNTLLEQVFNFCEKFHVDTLDMNDLYVGEIRSRRKAKKVTNLHHYQVELFNTIIDMQLQELNFRFNELLSLPDQLENFVMDMRVNIEAYELQGLGDISRKRVQTRRDVAYPQVY